jgi:Zn-dependent protease with chaperone function
VAGDSQTSLSRPRVIALATLAAALTASYYLCLAVLVIGLAAVTVLLFSALPVLVIFTIPIWVALMIVIRLSLPWLSDRSDEELPGIPCSRAERPQLWALVDEVCDRAGARPPNAIRLTLGGDAAVTELGGIRTNTRRCVLMLSLAFIQALSEAELRVVVAHEIGHLSAGDTMLLRLLDHAHRVVDRSLTEFEARASVLRYPFRSYVKAFFAITARLRRRSEIAADAFAASLYGPEQAALTLRKITHLSSAFDAYWRQEVTAVLDAGFRPPLMEGFALFLAAPEVTRTMRELPLDSDTGRFDLHPSTVERLSKFDAEYETDNWGGTALGLIERLEEVELALLSDLAAEAPSLLPIGWPDVPRRVFPPLWERFCSERPVFAPGAKVADTAELASKYQSATPEPGAAPPRQVLALAGALSLSLLRHGWEIDAPPGCRLFLRKDESSLQPFEEVFGLVENESARDQWAERCIELGIAEIPLELRPAAVEPTEAEAPRGGSIGEAIELSIPERGAKIASLIGAMILLAIALPFPILLLVVGAPSAQPTLTEQIVIRGLGGFVVALILGFLIGAAVRARRGRPRLKLDDSGLTLIHGSLLREPLILPREEIRVVSIDTGEVRRLRPRFPVYQDPAWESHEFRADTPRGWVWEDGRASLPVFGLTNATPNLLIVLKRAIPGPRVRRESFHGPFNGETLRGLLIRLGQPERAIPPLDALGILRPLTVSDFESPLPNGTDTPESAAAEPPATSTPK